MLACPVEVDGLEPETPLPGRSQPCHTDDVVWTRVALSMSSSCRCVQKASKLGPYGRYLPSPIARLEENR